MKVAYSKRTDSDKIPSGGVLVGTKWGALYNCCPMCNPNPITVDCDWNIYEFPYSDIEEFFEHVGSNPDWSIGCNVNNIY